MKLPISIAEKLIELKKGVKLPYSKLKHTVIKSMLENGVLSSQTIGRSKALIFLPSKNSLAEHLNNHFGIENLERYVELSKKTDLKRSEAIEIASNSKIKAIRTFKGILVNSYMPIECTLSNQKLTIQPQIGTYTFVYDIDNFKIPGEITVVGIENPENFQQIRKQRSLFKGITPLFVSRYPQNKDLIKWLKSIPNNYLHFGDFDISGINIYWNEYKKALMERATFFVPPKIEELLSSRGNRENYSNQTIAFNKQDINESNILYLIDMIEKYKKGLEQEILINSDSI